MDLRFGVLAAMRSVDRGIERVCETAAIVCGAMLIASAIYVSIDLIARKIFNLSFVGANEISGYVLAVSSAWAFSYAILKRSHIRIDVFYQYLPLRWRALIDVVAVATLAGFAAIFVWYANRYFFQVWGRGTRSITSLAIPLWIPMLAWYLGWIVFLVVSVYLTAVAAFAYARGDLATVRERAGSISDEEDLELELDPDARLGPEPPAREGA
jgi:TRAP-type C4-dicarboxylate transport system permease small subunit